MRILALTCTSALFLPLVACGTSSQASSGDTNKKFRVDFANYLESSTLFRNIHTNLDTSIKDHSVPVDVKWFDNNGDPATMLRNAQLMVNDKPDAIVIYPVSSATDSISAIIERSKIPCVSLNLDTKSCDFLNINNGALGDDTANIVGQIAKQRGWNASNTTVLIGQAASAGEQVNDCVRHFYSAIAPVLGLQQVDPTTITPTTTKIGDNGLQFDGKGSLQTSFDVVKNLLPSIPQGHHIILYTVNNDSTKGALRAIEEAGRGAESNLLIGGLGGDEAGISALRTDPRWVAEGNIFGSKWGMYAVAMAQALAKGDKPPAQVTALPQVVLDKKSVDEYITAGSTEPKLLPPLDSSNQYLRDGGLSKLLGNIKGE